MKARIINFLTIIAIVLPLLISLTSSSGGIVGVSTAGCTCHSAPTAATTVTITPAITSYTHDQLIDFTITVSNPTKVAGGFNLSKNIGIWKAVSSGAQIVGEEVTHTAPKPFIAGATSWTVTWQAPSTGNTPLQLFIAGNAVDLNLNNLNDEFNFGTIAAIPLPVEFVSFKSQQDKGSIKLNWNIANVVNASHFEIQRSFNGREFKTIAKQKITSTSEYHFIDQSPSLGANYYRLRQIDFDGKITMSETLFELLESNAKVKIFPNIICDGTINLLSESNNDDGLSLSFYNMYGHLALKTTVEGNKSDVSNLVNGVYLVKISSSDHQEISSQKIVVTN